MVTAVVPPAEHAVLVFLVQLVVLVGLARVAGSVVRRLGQPAVVGELLAGIVAGPSLFGRAVPQWFDWVFPDEPDDTALVFAVAWLGLLLLVALAGVESDLAVVRELGRPAAVVTVGSLVVPLAGGFLLGTAMPPSLIGPGIERGAFAAFLAVALSISSLPVVARVLAELGMVRRNVGQLVLAVAVANDVVGWLLLGLVVGVADPGAGGIGSTTIAVGAMGAFLAVWFTGGVAVVERLFERLAGPRVDTHVGVVIVIVAAAAAATQAIGVEAVLGAFVAGLVIGRSRWRDDRALAVVESMTNAVLAPLFFATAGLRVDLGVFTEPTVLVWSLAIVAAATMTKLLGAGLSARLARLPDREALALGVALNARGALEIVIASIGLSVGILTDASYAAIVIMALATSMAAPPLLRRILEHWPGTPAEQRRLAAEDFARRRVLATGRPPLVLTRGGAASIAASVFIDACWPPGHPVTLLTPEAGDRLGPVRNVFGARPTRVVALRRGGPDRIRAETQRGYGAIVVGVGGSRGAPALGDLHHAILSGATAPVVVVRRERRSGGALPPAYGHALVPVSHSVSSRAALELATGMAGALGTRLTLVHVLDEPVALGGSASFRSLDTAQPVLRAAADTARRAGALQVVTMARTADNVAAELHRLGEELAVDIMVVGTTITAGRLGATAGFLLDHAATTVAVVATPPGWATPPRGAPVDIAATDA